MYLRSATVEPVCRILLNFRRLRKVYTIGRNLAHKQVLMVAAAYNLKKFICFKSVKSVINVSKNVVMEVNSAILNSILAIMGYIRSLFQKTLKVLNLIEIY